MIGFLQKSVESGLTSPLCEKFSHFFFEGFPNEYKNQAQIQSTWQKYFLVQCSLGRFQKKKGSVGLLQPRYVDRRQPTPNLLFFKSSKSAKKIFFM